jgi:hypothetical protein
MIMNKINIQIQASEIIKAAVADGAIFDAMPVLKIGDAVVIDLSRFIGCEKLVFKHFHGSYLLTGYRIDTSDKNSVPELILERLD